MVKRDYYFSRGSGFHSQHPDGILQLPEILGRYSFLFWPLRVLYIDGTHSTHKHVASTHTCTKKELVEK